MDCITLMRAYSGLLVCTLDTTASIYYTIHVTDDRPYMIILDLIRPFRSYMVRPYMV